MKKIETIRVSKKLAGLLSEVPKGTSYAEWIIDKIERLQAHNENSVYWIISAKNIGSNRMSVGDRDGRNPIFDETIFITDKIPVDSKSAKVQENGWLEQADNLEFFSHGGFASKEAAHTYIINYMGGRLIERSLLGEHNVDQDQYTTAKYDHNKYFFVEDWFKGTDPKPEDFSDDELKLFEKNMKEIANKNGYCILGDVAEYIRELRDSK